MNQLAFLASQILALQTSPVSAARADIDGLLMGFGSVSTVDVGAGSVPDDTNTLTMTLAAPAVLDISVDGAVNRFDAGNPANSSWCYVYIIAKADGTGVGTLGSASASAPTLPATYTLKRLIGAVRVGTTGDIVDFTQQGRGRSRVFRYEVAGAGTQTASTTAVVNTTYAATGDVTFPGIPPIAEDAFLHFNWTAGAANEALHILPKGASEAGAGQVIASLSALANGSTIILMRPGTSQAYRMKTGANATGGFTAWVLGWSFTV